MMTGGSPILGNHKMAPEGLIEIPVFFNSTVVGGASQLQSSAADEQSALALKGHKSWGLWFVRLHQLGVSIVMGVPPVIIHF